MKRFACLAIVLAAGQALAWDSPGHALTGRIARQILEERADANDTQARRALQKLDNLLAQCPSGYHELGAACTYPDSDEGRRNEDLDPFHFVNVSISRRDQYDAHWPGTLHIDGVSKAIAELQKKVSGGATNRPVLRELSQPMALMYWLHFMGDIHQPLHVGDYRDRGGNRSFVEFTGSDGRRSEYKLHEYWDKCATFNLSALPSRDRARHLIAQYSPSVQQAAIQDLEVWARESYEDACDFAYNVDLNNGRRVSREKTVYPAGRDYKKHWRQSGLSRMTLAGYRMADRIRSVLGQTP